MRASAALLFLLAAVPVSAHHQPVDLLEIIVQDDGMRGNAVVHASERTDELLLDSFALSADGKAIEPRLIGVEAVPDRSAWRLHFRLKWAAPPRALEIRCRLVPELPRLTALVSVRRDGATAGTPVVLAAGGPAREFLARAPGAWETFLSYLAQGIHHIFIGPDHIAFILGLILLGGALSRLALIVTAFTLAHSVTLALAALGLFAPPASVIEPLIALSIVVIGIENLRHGKVDRRAAIAFGFGFIHGFGFAEVLRDAGLPRAALGAALFSFNLGVEAAQLCIVGAALPVLALLRRRRWPVERLSWIIVVAGLYWLFSRLFTS